MAESRGTGVKSVYAVSSLWALGLWHIVIWVLAFWKNMQKWLCPKDLRAPFKCGIHLPDCMVSEVRRLQSIIILLKCSDHVCQWKTCQILVWRQRPGVSIGPIWVGSTSRLETESGLRNVVLSAHPLSRNFHSPKGGVMWEPPMEGSHSVFK
jgi:hypothetical protein